MAESFVCPHCHRATYHPADIAARYCPCCGSPPLLPKDCPHAPEEEFRMGPDETTLGGRPLTAEDWLWLGVLVAAVDGCRSVYLDSEGARVELRGLPDFSRAILAVEHFRRRAGRSPSV